MWLWLLSRRLPVSLFSVSLVMLSPPLDFQRHVFFLLLPLPLLPLHMIFHSASSICCPTYKCRSCRVSLLFHLFHSYILGATFHHLDFGLLSSCNLVTSPVAKIVTELTSLSGGEYEDGLLTKLTSIILDFNYRLLEHRVDFFFFLPRWFVSLFLSLSNLIKKKNNQTSRVNTSTCRLTFLPPSPCPSPRSSTSSSFHLTWHKFNDGNILSCKCR